MVGLKITFFLQLKCDLTLWTRDKNKQLIVKWKWNVTHGTQTAVSWVNALCLLGPLTSPPARPVGLFSSLNYVTTALSLCVNRCSGRIYIVVNGKPVASNTTTKGGIDRDKTSVFDALHGNENGLGIQCISIASARLSTWWRLLTVLTAWTVQTTATVVTEITVFSWLLRFSDKVVWNGVISWASQTGMLTCTNMHYTARITIHTEGEWLHSLLK